MAVDMFLKLDGIEGESRDSKHKHEIDVLSWSWGIDSPGSSASPSNRPTRANFQDLSVTKYIDKATVDLMLHCSNGKHIPEATLVVRKAGETPLEYLIIKMQDVLVTSYDVNVAAGEDQPADNVTLNFTKVHVKYTPQDDTGSQQPPKEFGWDIKKNREF